MLIEMIHQDAEQRLLSLVEGGEQPIFAWGALHFPFSKLNITPSEEELLLTVRPVLEGKPAAIYFFRDGDVVISWSGTQKTTLEALCSRLYEHYGPASETSHRYYDLQVHGEDIRLLCKHKMEALASPFATAKKSLTALAPSTEQIAFFRKLAALRKQRKQLEILVVEDQPFSSKLLIGVLDRLCKAYPAFNAETALELYLTHAPDIVFLDIELPGINGHELAAIIRKLDADAYIIMVTANHYAEDVARAKENDAIGFVVKPYSKQKILAGIEKYIHERKLKP